MKTQSPENMHLAHLHNEVKFGINSLCNLSTNQFPWSEYQVIGFCPELPMQMEILDNTK